MKIKVKKALFLFLAFLLLFLLGLPLGMLSGHKQGRVLLNDTVTLPFEVKENERVLLLYLGYVGCQTICIPSLKESANIFNILPKREDVAFYFINISKEGVGAKEFAQFFHEDFQAVQLPRKETLALMGELRAYSSDPLIEGGDLYHTGYLYLVKQVKKNEFILKAMYFTRPFEAETIISDIQKELE
ncbi:MAG: SCO family protein [Campylobacterales bacterium]|nr:SCO family protein [Campylobacterales bacterium]